MSSTHSWRILALLPFYVLVPWAPLMGPVNTSDVLPMFGAILAAFCLRSHGKEVCRASPVWVALGALGLLMFVSHCVNPAGGFSLGAGARTAGRMGLFALLGISFSLIQRRGFQQLALQCFSAVVVFEAGFGFLAAVTGYSGPWGLGAVDYPPGHFPASGWPRAQGTFGGPVPEGVLFVNRANFYSAYLTIGLFVTLHTLRHRLVAQWAAGFVVFAGIAASGTRMSLIASVLGAAAYLWLKGGRKATYVLIPFALLGTALIPAVKQRLVSGFADRLMLWEQALYVIRESPWLGSGDGQYLQALANAMSHAEPVLHTPHNSILYAAATYGIPVALCLIGLYGYLLYKSVAGGVWPPAIGGLTVAFICHDMTNNLFFIPEVALSFWLGWALLMPAGVSDD